MQVKLRKSEEDGNLAVQVETEIDFPARAVFPLVADPKRRQQWDKICRSNCLSVGLSTCLSDCQS